MFGFEDRDFLLLQHFCERFEVVVLFCRLDSARLKRILLSRGNPWWGPFSQILHILHEQIVGRGRWTRAGLV